VNFDPRELYEYVRQRRFECLGKGMCPVWDRCPDKQEFGFQIDKEAWLIRNCPKVREDTGRPPK